MSTHMICAAPPEQFLGHKGARLVRLFDLIRQQDLTRNIAAHHPNPNEITPQFAKDFLHAAHMSLRPA